MNEPLRNVHDRLTRLARGAIASAVAAAFLIVVLVGSFMLVAIVSACIVICALPYVIVRAVRGRRRRRIHGGPTVVDVEARVVPAPQIEAESEDASE